jgi:hypothetical protein
VLLPLCVGPQTSGHSMPIPRLLPRVSKPESLQQALSYLYAQISRSNYELQKSRVTHFQELYCRETPTTKTAGCSCCYHSCQSCGAIFVAKECLKVHKWVHESSKNWPYKCTEWFVIFHVQIHIANQCIATLGFIAEAILAATKLYSIFPYKNGDIRASSAGKASAEKRYWLGISQNSMSHTMNGNMSVSSAMSIIPLWTICEHINESTTLLNPNILYAVQNARVGSFNPAFSESTS